MTQEEGLTPLTKSTYADEKSTKLVQKSTKHGQGVNPFSMDWGDVQMVCSLF